MNSNLKISPTLFISLLEASSLPIGTSSNARLGSALIVDSILSFNNFCDFSILSISFDIFFDLENWLLFCFLDNNRTSLVDFYILHRINLE